MWVIYGDLLYSVPDDAPVPRGATAVEPPTDFLDDPTGWTIRDGGFAKLKAKRAAPSGLSAADVDKIKAAIAAGKL